MRDSVVTATLSASDARDHWAFQPVRKPAVPTVKNQKAVRTPIDAFLLARLEEKKLLVYHGDTYRRYMARVPGLIPLPWKSLTAAEAEAPLKQK